MSHPSKKRYQPAVSVMMVHHGFKPFSPHDALKHHFTSLKTDLTFPKEWVLERKFP